MHTPYLFNDPGVGGVEQTMPASTHLGERQFGGRLPRRPRRTAGGNLEEAS
jgi:hypothetical protein